MAELISPDLCIIGGGPAGLAVAERALALGASVVIVDPRVGNGFTQLIRGGCDTPTARMDRPTPLSVQQVMAGIRQAGVPAGG